MGWCFLPFPVKGNSPCAWDTAAGPIPSAQQHPEVRHSLSLNSHSFIRPHSVLGRGSSSHPHSLSRRFRGPGHGSQAWVLLSFNICGTTCIEIDYADHQRLKGGPLPSHPCTSLVASPLGRGLQADSHSCSTNLPASLQQNGRHL